MIGTLVPSTWFCSQSRHTSARITYNQRRDKQVEDSLEPEDRADHMPVVHIQLRKDMADQGVTYAGKEGLPSPVAQTHRLFCPFQPCAVSAIPQIYTDYYRQSDVQGFGTTDC